ncbi:MAG: four helix bundle protein [Spirosomataceae bacterium]|jgi:four helix bundle protein
MAHNFRKLTIWSDAITVVKNVYKLTATFPPEEKFGLMSQSRRCAISIPSNIAEGSGRNSDKDFRRFLSISLSSSYELETQLIVANELDMLSSHKLQVIIDELNKLQRMIYSFCQSLKDE